MHVREENVPWLNDEYISLIHEVKSHASVARHTKEPNDVRIANRARNRRNITRDALKRDYFTSQVEENKYKSKRLWKILNKLLSTKSKSTHITELVGESDPSKICEIFSTTTL